jgi:hypothetical protein
MKEKIEIPFSKNKIYRDIAVSLIFIIAGIWIFSNPNLFQDFPLKFVRNPIVIKSIGAISVLFFGLTGIIGIKKLFDKKLD